MELSTKSDEMSLASLVDAEEVRSTCCLLLFFISLLASFYWVIVTLCEAVRFTFWLGVPSFREVPAS